MCGRAKTEVFENDYVTGIGMSQLKKQNGSFLIRFRWSSVDGRKRCKKQKTEVFKNALVWTGPNPTCTKTVNYPGTKQAGVVFELRKRMTNLPWCAHVPHKTLNLVISRCCFAEGGKETDVQNDYFFLIKQIVPLRPYLRSLSISVTYMYWFIF